MANVAAELCTTMVRMRPNTKNRITDQTPMLA